MHATSILLQLTHTLDQRRTTYHSPQNCLFRRGASLGVIILLFIFY